MDTYSAGVATKHEFREGSPQMCSFSASPFGIDYALGRASWMGAFAVAFVPLEIAITV